MPASRATPKSYRNARALRLNLTPAEGKLWARLRNKQLGVSFRRQHALGNYIVDFCCIQKKLVIELDGSQHLEQETYDAERSSYLQARGYQVIRFWNDWVMKDVEGVVAEIARVLEAD
jgi:very-short-patch-repair endonuclease